jgi:hypothetical protein
MKLGNTYVSEKHIASIYRFEKLSKEETRAPTCWACSPYLWASSLACSSITKAETMCFCETSSYLRTSLPTTHQTVVFIDAAVRTPGFLRIFRFPLPNLIPLTAPHSPSSIIGGWYNRPISGRRTKWTQSHPTPRD